MVLHEADVAILGAGAAGLAAAGRLTRAGRTVVLVEARTRLGGRIRTRHDRRWPVPLEDGAEFLHGRHPAVWRLLRQASLAPYELPEEHWVRARGRLAPIGDFWTDVETVLDRMPAHGRRDLSFRAFLGRQRGLDPHLARLATLFVEGFHAGPAGDVSVHALAQQAKADDAADTTQHRLAGGYDGLVAALVRQIDPARCRILRGAPVRTVTWSGGRVDVEATRRGRLVRVRARRAVVTLPTAVLARRPPDPGALRFRPDLPDKRRAARLLPMGHVVKAAVLLRRPFWETDPFPGLPGRAPLRHMTFLHSLDAPFRTWWTYRPLRVPVLMGWAGGPAARRLRGLSAAALRRTAVASLAQMLGLPTGRVAAEVQAVHVAQWQTDPFARGAYSYVRVGGERAPQALAAPVADTLFFAGEATHARGMTGTVPGAIETGWRAADEILGRHAPGKAVKARGRAVSRGAAATPRRRSPSG